MRILCKYDELVKPKKLKPNPRNPNTHPEEQIRLLGKILSVAWRQAIVVSKRSGLITKGHGRRRAAIKAGLEFVPVEYQEYETDEEENTDLIADNQIASLSILDTTILKDVLGELDSGAIDMELTGFSENDLSHLMSQFHQGDSPTMDTNCPYCKKPL
jgi:ParB-like chromosome segregation protein Spo0J